MSALLQAPWGTATATPITQAGHGFTLGQQVYFDGTSWQLAIATGLATLRVATVAQVVDASRFLVMFEGAMQWPAHGLTLGATYYLSDATPGAITPIPPAAAASIDQPCVKPITPDFVRLIDYVIVDSAPASAFPSGTISPYAGQTSSIQSGWLLCDGAEYSQAVYPDLYGIILDYYGKAAAGNFRVPDLRGRQLVMADQGSNRLSNNPNNSTAFSTVTPSDIRAGSNVDSWGWEIVVLEGSIRDGNHVVGRFMNSRGDNDRTFMECWPGPNGYFRLNYRPTASATRDRFRFDRILTDHWNHPNYGMRVVVTAELRDGTRVTCCDGYSSSQTVLTADNLFPNEDVTNLIMDFSYPNGVPDAPWWYEFMFQSPQRLFEGNIANSMTRMPRSGAWATNSTGAHAHTLNTAGEHTHSNTTYRTQGSSQWGSNQFGHATDNDFPQTSGTSTTGAHAHTLNSQGNHTHTISGGDYQTRPSSVVMNYLIKT